MRYRLEDKLDILMEFISYFANKTCLHCDGYGYYVKAYSYPELCPCVHYRLKEIKQR